MTSSSPLEIHIERNSNSDGLHLAPTAPPCYLKAARCSGSALARPSSDLHQSSVNDAGSKGRQDACTAHSRHDGIRDGWGSAVGWSRFALLPCAKVRLCFRFNGAPSCFAFQLGRRRRCFIACDGFSRPMKLAQVCPRSGRAAGHAQDDTLASPLASTLAIFRTGSGCDPWSPKRSPHVALRDRLPRLDSCWGSSHVGR